MIRKLWLVPMVALMCLLGGCEQAEIGKIQTSLRTVTELQKSGVLTETSADAQRQVYLAKANQILGRELTLAELEQWQGIAGYLTFWNIIAALAALLIVVALVALFGIYIVPLLLALPKELWELFGYVLCGALMYGHGEVWFALLGCLGFAPLLAWTYSLHIADSAKPPVTALAGIIAIVWAAVAIFHGSALIAGLSVLAFEAFLGFSVIVMPLCYGIGFTDEDAVPRATTASLVLLLFGVFLSLQPSVYADAPSWVGHAAIFQPGLLLVGTFVYFVGLLILSSGFHTEGGNYWPLQFLTVASGLIALYVGSVFGIGLLQGIGGVFFALYLIEKYIEVCWSNKNIAWSALGLGIVLMGIAWVARAHPQYFLFGFKLAVK